MVSIEKLDEVILHLEKLLAKQQKYYLEIENHEWTADIILGSIMIITFPKNNKFKKFVESIGGRWIAKKKGYVFWLNNKDEVIDKIQKKFPYWIFINNLIVESE